MSVGVAVRDCVCFVCPLKDLQFVQESCALALFTGIYTRTVSSAVLMVVTMPRHSGIKANMRNTFLLD